MLMDRLSIKKSLTKQANGTLLDSWKEVWLEGIKGWAPSLCTRGCPISIWTGLNIKICIVKKLCEWSNCPFAEMILQLENHFGKKPAWSLIYFLNYAYIDIQPSPNNYETPSVSWHTCVKLQYKNDWLFYHLIPYGQLRRAHP